MKSGNNSTWSRSALALVVALQLAGCMGNGDPASPGNGPSIDPDEPPAIEYWYLHHKGGCNENGRAFMNRTPAEAEYRSCAQPTTDQFMGNTPVEVWPADEPWNLTKRGAIINGRIVYEPSGPAPVDLRVVLVLEGRAIAEQHIERTDSFGNPPLRLVVIEIWLNLTLSETIPAGAMPELQFWAEREFVWSVSYYDTRSYLCIIPPDLPSYALHVGDMFNDCRAEEHAR